MANMRGKQVARAVARAVRAHRDDDELCAFYFHKLMEHIGEKVMLYEWQISLRKCHRNSVGQKLTPVK